MVGPFADWSEATVYLKSASIEIFPDWRDSQWEDFARQCYVELDGQVIVDYDPRIAEPLAAESNDTEAGTLWSLFAAMSAVQSLLIRGDLTDLLTESCVVKMREVHPDMAVLSVPRVGHAPMLNESGVTEAIRRFLTA